MRTNDAAPSYTPTISPTEDGSDDGFAWGSSLVVSEPESLEYPAWLSQKLAEMERNPYFLLESRKEIVGYLSFTIAVGATTIPFFLIPSLNYVRSNERTLFEIVMVPLCDTVVNVLFNGFAGHESWFGYKRSLSSAITIPCNRIMYVGVITLLAASQFVPSVAIVATQSNGYSIFVQTLVYISTIIYSTPLNIYSAFELINMLIQCCNFNKASRKLKFELADKIYLLSRYVVTPAASKLRDTSFEVLLRSYRETYCERKNYVNKRTQDLIWLASKILASISALLLATTFVSSLCSTQDFFDNYIDSLYAGILTILFNFSIVYIGIQAGFYLVDKPAQNLQFALKGEPFDLPVALRFHPVKTVVFCSVGNLLSVFSYGFAAELVHASCSETIKKVMLPFVTFSVPVFNAIFCWQFVFMVTEACILFLNRDPNRNRVIRSKLLYELSQTVRAMSDVEFDRTIETTKVQKFLTLFNPVGDRDARALATHDSLASRVGFFRGKEVVEAIATTFPPSHSLR